MKLFPAKCHERATLRKFWRQTGKQFTVAREMLTAVLRDQRWPDVVAGISTRFSKFAFVLFCYITNHLMTGPLGNSEFCFPRISMFPSTSSRETLRFSGKKTHCSPRDQSLSVKCSINLPSRYHGVMYHQQYFTGGASISVECSFWPDNEEILLSSCTSFLLLLFSNQQSITVKHSESFWWKVNIQLFLHKESFH